MYIWEMFGHRPEEAELPDSQFYSNRRVGIEIEVENAQELRSGAVWNVTDDGSLRNHGRELVLRGALGGMSLGTAMTELEALLARAPRLHCSERTSLHVHIDVRDLDHTKVQNILIAYIAVESALYKMGGKDRYDNIYCPGVTAALEQISIMRKLATRSTSHFQAACHEWCKYTGINMNSVAIRGSVEFRTHEGTVNTDRIITWVNTLQQLVEYAISKDGLEDILRDVRQGAEPLLRTIFDDTYAEMLLQDGDYLRYYQNNLTNLIDLTNDETYKYKVKEGRSTGNSDTAAVIASLQEAIARSRRDAA